MFFCRFCSYRRRAFRVSSFFRLHLKTVIPLFLTTLGLVVLSENVDPSKPPAPPTDRSSKLSRHPVVIVVSFDGFRYNYFQRTDTPNMDIVRDSGVSVQYMRNQFVTKTFPNHMSIATGLHTESHGVIDNILFDPKYNRVLDAPYADFWNPDNLTTPLWTLNELAGDGRHSGVMMWPGSKFPYGVNDTLPTRIFEWENDYPFDKRVDIAVDWITDEETPVNLLFIYFEEPDEVAHGYGPESAEVTKYISIVDNTTGYLIKKLKQVGIYDKVNVILLSDHGFHEVKQQHIINYTSVLRPGTYETYGYSPVMHILPKEGMLEEIYANLKNLSVNKNFTVYKKEDTESTWFYKNNRRIMPILLVAELGFVFEDFWGNIQSYNRKFNFTPSPNRIYGTHGWDNRQLPMHPFFMARGPAFRIGYQGDVFDNVDIYPLICNIIGIKPAPNNGTLSNVRQLLRKQGFAMGSPVGWAMGAAVLIGIGLVLGIMSLLVSSRHWKHRRDPQSNIRDFIEIGGGEYRDGKSSSNGLPANTEECQALLLSSSTEEL